MHLLMLSRLEHYLISPSSMEIEIQLDRPDLTYSNLDLVTGYVILRGESSMDVTTIDVTLSASATTRLTSKNRTESHQLLRRTQQVFPSLAGFEGSPSQYRTIRRGVNSFPFSIKFPQVSECYKEGMDDGEGPGSCVNVRTRSRKVVHLLRKLPPSMGDASSPGEIVYYLNATVNRDGFLNGPVRAGQKIFFYPLSGFNPPANSLTTQKCLIEIEPGIAKIFDSASYQIDITLTNGGCLLLGRPIPLEVYMTRLSEVGCDVLLNDFQSMLIETTNIRAQGNAQTRKHCEVIQTVTNVGQLASSADTSVGSRLCIPDSLWKHRPLPYTLTPTFEACNISRTYKLEIRLGFRFNLPTAQTRIIATEFPVYVLNSYLHNGHHSNPQIPGQCDEKEVLRYGLDRGAY